MSPWAKEKTVKESLPPVIRSDMEKSGAQHGEELADETTETNEYIPYSGDELAEVATQNFKWDLTTLTNLLALLCCYFSATWGLLIPSFSIPFIVQAFPEGAPDAAWIAAAATISSCIFQSFQGDLSDILGRKIFLLAGMGLGIAGTLISGRASGIKMVIGGQVLNGCGLTLGYLAVPLLAEVVPKDKRPLIGGIGGMSAGVASILGPIVQGLCIKKIGPDHQGWRVGFYICAGFYMLTFGLLVMFYHPVARPNEEGLSTPRKVMNLDWIGLFLVTAGLVLFLVGLQYGGNQYSWTSAVVLSTLITGVVLLIGFGVWEWKGRPDGLCHHALFIHRNFAVTQALNFVGGIVLFGGQAYLPQEITRLFTNDAVLTGIYNIPFNAMSIVSGIIGGIIMGITKEAKPLVVVSFIFLVIGSGLMAVLDLHINFAAWFFGTSLLGLAIGIQTSLISVVASLCTPNKYIATAMSVCAAVRALGGSIGIVIFSQIYDSKVASTVPSQVSQALLQAGLPSKELQSFMEAASVGDQAALLEMPGVTPAILGVYASATGHAYADCYRFIWYGLIPFAAVALIMSFSLKSTKAQMTQQVAAGVQR